MKDLSYIMRNTIRALKAASAVVDFSDIFAEIERECRRIRTRGPLAWRREISWQEYRSLVREFASETITEAKIAKMDLLPETRQRHSDAAVIYAGSAVGVLFDAFIKDFTEKYYK